MTVKISSKQTLYNKGIFKLVEENITLDNGVNTTVSIIRHPGAAAIVPLLDDNTLILIKQYRHALADYIWEIPAGTRTPGEDPLECAKRELTEETGYVGHKWREIGQITPVPGYSDEIVHLFLAYDLTESIQNLDRDEVLNVHKISFNDAIEMIHTGKIQDGKTICGLFTANHLLNQKKQMETPS